MDNVKLEDGVSLKDVIYFAYTGRFLTDSEDPDQQLGLLKPERILGWLELESSLRAPRLKLLALQVLAVGIRSHLMRSPSWDPLSCLETLVKARRMAPDCSDLIWESCWPQILRCHGYITSVVGTKNRNYGICARYAQKYLESLKKIGKLDGGWLDEKLRTKSAYSATVKVSRDRETATEEKSMQTVDVAGGTN